VSITIPPCNRPWCAQPGGHDGNHIRQLGDVAVPTHNAADRVAVSVECGNAEHDPQPVLTLVSTPGVPLSTVRLDWLACFRLVDLLAGAANRFG
jgi:hypothetical protein